MVCWLMESIEGWSIKGWTRVLWGYVHCHPTTITLHPHSL